MEEKTSKQRRLQKIKRSKHDVVVDYGDQLVYCITPEPGNYIKKVTVDRKLQGSVDSLTFEDVKKNHIVTVRFESEEKSGYRKNHSVTNRQIFFNDDDDQSEQQTFHESPVTKMTIPVNPKQSLCLLQKVKRFKPMTALVLSNIKGSGQPAP